VKTGQQLKEDAYGKAAVLLAQGKVVIPAECADLVSQLLTVTADPTAGGGLRIGTPTERVHDDLADAFCFMLAGLPEADQLATVPERPVPDGVTWADSVGGVRVPVPFTLARPDMSYRDMHGGYWTCPKCRAPAPAYKTACQAPACDGQNPQPLPGPAPSETRSPEASPWLRRAWRLCRRRPPRTGRPCGGGRRAAAGRTPGKRTAGRAGEAVIAD
jgi:hypothetical protein